MREAHVYVTMCIYCKMITIVSLVNVRLTYKFFFHCDTIICLAAFKYRAHAVHCILGASQVALVVQWRRCKRHGFDPWVGKIPWRREWQPTPVFLPGEPPGQRNLVGYSPWGRKESGQLKRLSMHTCTLFSWDFVSSDLGFFVLFCFMIPCVRL